MAIYRLDALVPSLDESSYVADAASVIGRVTLGRDSSVWSQAVLRADNEPIVIGDGSSVQEGAVLHTDPGYPLVVGAGVSIGLQAMLHGCSVGDGSFIGDRAVVLNGAVIGRNSVVVAGSLVTEGKVFPDNSLIRGTPAKAVEQLSDTEIAKLGQGARAFVERTRRYKAALKCTG
jgi:carbonic anhydrase/acetyltransferase-like protein (isoleucine patch superfamily)